ncbi:MAG: glycosyltransferase [Fervidicoccus fontis]
MNTILLDIVALMLGLMHFGVPLAYYFYMKRKYLKKPWNIRVDENYKPKVTIIIPTYREAEYIRDKLDNIYFQSYPRSLMEVIVVDSASDDGTVDLVKQWISEHRDLDLKLIVEPVRKGKLHAVLESLKHVSPESSVIVFTDADAFWERDALKKAVKYFTDPSVGAVTASILYSDKGAFENVYRNYYNIIRIAESKVFATPVHNGPFLAIRADLIRKYGLPIFPGSDDSSFGSYLAFIGFRAIQVDDVLVEEPVRGSQLRRKIRRAQHLLLNLLKTKHYAKRLGVYKYTEPFENVWKIEWWLHLVNPWLLIFSVILLTVNMLHGSLTTLLFLGIGSLLLLLKTSRVWILQQVYLTIAAVRNLWTKEIMWSK